jgi:predicted secreted Zn-dependent protease
MAQEAVKNTKFYDIQGRTAEDLHEAMDKYGPSDRNHGRRVWAHTRWYVKWKFEYEERRNQCSIKSVKTETTIDFNYPRWTNKSDGPRAVQRRWEEFMATLIKHENKHAKHGLLAAAEVRKVLPQLPPQRTCERMKEVAKAKGKEITDKYHAMDIEYDRRTRNGATEGITMP